MQFCFIIPSKTAKCKQCKQDLGCGSLISKNRDKKNVSSAQKKEGAPQKDTLMRTAFIRVSKENKTGEDKNDLVTYTKEQIKDTLDLWAFESGLTYWFIEHNPDEEDNNTHFHIVIKFKTNSRFSTIKSKFPYGHIEPILSTVKKTVQYLVHLNHPEKLAYKWEDIITNGGDLSEFKTLSRSQQEVHLQRIIGKIESGEINMQNVELNTPIDIYSKHTNVINNALKYKMRIQEADIKNKKLHVIYMFGPSRVGKSEFAWNYCKSLYPNEDPCLSSNSNDPLQDYKGEKCLIWNDFRDSQFKFTDLLTFIDPYYRSSGNSRYYNKRFLGDVLIFTSTVRLDFLYKGCQDQTEDMKQFRARISEYYIFSKDEVRIFLYDKPSDHFFPFRVFDNPRSKSNSDETIKPIGSDFNFNLFNKMGISLQEPGITEDNYSSLPTVVPVLSDEDLYKIKKQEMDNLDLKGKCSIFLQDYPQYNIATVTAKAAAHEFIKQYPEVGLCHGTDYIINTMALCKQGCRNI